MKVYESFEESVRSLEGAYHKTSAVQQAYIDCLEAVIEKIQNTKGTLWKDSFEEFIFNAARKHIVGSLLKDLDTISSYEDR